MAEQSGEIGQPGRALFAVSEALVRDRLHMPDTARIIGVEMSADGYHIDLLVESPDLPRGEPSRVNPTLTHHQERFEWSWGIAAEEASDGR